MTARPAYPNLWQAIVLLMALLLFQAGAGLLMPALNALPGIEIELGSALATGVANLAAFALVLGFGLRRGGVTARDALPFKPFPRRSLLPLTLTVFGLGILLSELDNLTQSAFPLPDFIAELYETLSSGGLVTLVVLVVVAPLTEELLFRGLILHGFLRWYRPGTAIVLSALLFALVHVNPYQFPTGFFAGMLLGWVFVATRSLWPCLFLHALFNAQGWIVGGILGLEIPGYTDVSLRDAVRFQPLWFDMLGMALLIIGVAGTARVLGVGSDNTPDVDTQPSEKEATEHTEHTDNQGWSKLDG